MMAAFSIDIHHEQVLAWRALNRARREEAAGTFPSGTLAEMEALFYAMPVHTMPDGSRLPFNPENYRAIRNDWRDAERWEPTRIGYVIFFRDNYRRVVDLGP